MNLETIIFLLIYGGTWTSEAVNSPCDSPQYLPLGTRSTINCLFVGSFANLQWYAPTDQENAVIAIRESGKTGRGLLSGEYDIFANGSLIINTVTLEHEGTFTALFLRTLTSTAERFDVEVFVFGPSLGGQPHIQNCSADNEICFQTWNRHGEVSCLVQDARPAVSLSWMVRTILGDQNVTSNFSYTNTSNNLFTSRATTGHPFTYSNLLALLVCKADSPPGLLGMNESLVLLQNEEEGIHTSEPVMTYATVGSKLEIKCSVNTIVYLVWHVRTFSQLVFQRLGVAYLTNTYKTFTGGYNMNDKGSLTINNVTTQHEGVYRCISSDGFVDDVVVYGVLVFSPPDPGHLLVNGCDSVQECTLEVPPEGSLTCSLKRIRPIPSLGFRTINDNSKHILFYEKNSTVKDNGDTFDVSLTSKYRVNDSMTTSVSIECALIGQEMNVFNLSAKLELRITKDETSTNKTPSETSQDGPSLIWIAIVAVVIVFSIPVVAVLMAASTLKGSFPTRRPRTEEDTPMVSFDKTREFIEQLKVRYEDLCNAVQPIPNLPGNPCCINRVFVDSGMKYLDTDEQNGGQAKSWKKMGSYTTILNDRQKHALRCIVEGEPGYGKSMLSLQLAYDWYTSITDSTQQTESVLIILRLRELSETSSFYSAIKEYLLPMDTKLSESDIEDILSDKNRSVLVVMDGFDEYPHKNSTNDITSIIERKKCQSFKVIITTRTSHLPNDYPPLTKRIRLTGFDKTAREQYIGKLVPDDESKILNIIQRKITEIPLLKELCQVPLFFVLFVQLIYENEQFQSFQSVTTFFRSLMTCLCNHMKRKMTVEKSELHIISETDQRKLEELAFHALCDENPKLTWLKEDLLERLGRDVCDHYVSMGILIEEDAVDFVDMQRKKNVRFYHDIFCEWFAAHRLADISDTNLSYPDPFRFQYVYRFACGINWRASRHIFKILQKYGDFIFFFLCMLEVDGRYGDKLEHIKFLCSSTVRVEVLQSRLLQRSVKEVLEVASSNKIPVNNLWLYDCYNKVDPSPEINIQLKSHVAIPVLPTLLELWIQETGGEIIWDEVTHIFQYCLRCEKLKELRFLECLLPYVIQTEQLSALNARNCKVTWQPRGVLEAEYQLNLVSGTWETAGNGAAEMNNEDYEKEVKQFNIRYRHRETDEPRPVTDMNDSMEGY